MGEQNQARGRSVIMELTPQQQEQLCQAQADQEHGREDTIERGRQLKAATDEPTLSGALRRAVHAASAVDLGGLARKAKITPEDLDAFLLGRPAVAVRRNGPPRRGRRVPVGQLL